ncbi:MAG TPA: PilW family protein [Burkholderiales bacterium]|nr:PilW family protein [Burkholderiales bacterium]
MTLARRQSGLSLIELMVSMTLGLIVLSGVLVVFVNSSAARNEVERTTRQIENGRYASELLTDDLRVAGFWGQLDPTTVATPAALPADPCSLTVADWNAWLPVHIQGYDAASFTSTNCALTNYKAGTDVLVIRRARTCSANATTCTPNVTAGTPYLQVSLCATQVTKYVLDVYPSSGTAPFDMQTKACDATLANKREYYVHIYYIATDNGRGDSVPTLKRLELVGGTTPSWSTVPLVEGIENLQLLYGVDTNNDGVPDEYVANPTTLARWMNVVTTQFFVLARNLESSQNYSDTKTYTLGKDASGTAITYTPSGSDVGYRRHVYSGLVRIMNPAGRRDTP